MPSALLPLESGAVDSRVAEVRDLPGDEPR